MGVSTIDFDTYPEQSEHVGKPVRVCFNYDTSKQLWGKIIRKDAEEPHLTIIELEDNRVVLATECQWQPAW